MARGSLVVESSSSLIRARISCAWQPVHEADAEAVKEICLLDVFFALEHGHGRLLTS